jgi:hypothetical protein
MNNEEGTPNDGIRFNGGPRRGRLPAIRVAAAVAATATLALLAAACGASPSSAGAGGSPGPGESPGSPSAVAYSGCMRSHGVPNYPDPSNGQLPKGGAHAFGVSSSVFSAAQSTCHHLLPDAGSFQEQASQCTLSGDCPPALVQQMMTTDLKFAQCMRSHGVPSWPDPTIGLGGQPVFNLTQVGITHSQTHSAPMSNEITECQRLENATLTFGLMEN